MYILTTNDKTIKLWRISQKTKIKVVSKPSEDDEEISFPKLEKVSNEGLVPQLRKTYPNLHNWNINSISRSSDCEHFISSDDLKINLWNFEYPKKAFNIVDIKPEGVEDLQEVITCSSFHPIDSNMFLYSTSKGIIQVGDMRRSSKF